MKHPTSPPWTYADLGFQEIWGWKHDAVAYLIVHSYDDNDWSASVKDLFTGRVVIFPDVFVGLKAGKALCRAKFKQAKS